MRATHRESRNRQPARVSASAPITLNSASTSLHHVCRKYSLCTTLLSSLTLCHIPLSIDPIIQTIHNNTKQGNFTSIPHAPHPLKKTIRHPRLSDWPRTTRLLYTTPGPTSGQSKARISFHIEQEHARRNTYSKRRSCPDLGDLTS